jgi:hypothetical protein
VPAAGGNLNLHGCRPAAGTTIPALTRAVPGCFSGQAIQQRHALRDGITHLQLSVAGLQWQHRQRQVAGHAGNRAQRRAVLLHAIAGLCRCRGMQQLHRTLGLAEEVGAGDDFLARVAALLHAVAVQAVQAQLLRGPHFALASSSRGRP